jgi:hypothetical protein
MSSNSNQQSWKIFKFYQLGKGKFHLILSICYLIYDFKIALWAYGFMEAKHFMEEIFQRLKNY